MCGMLLFRRAVVTGCLASFLFLPSVLLAAEKAKTTDKIEDLLQERLGIAQKIQKIVVAQYRSGNVAFGVLHEAEVAVLKARLELCQTKQDRIKVYEDVVREAETQNRIAEARLKGGYRITEVEVLRIRDYLLECQIGLERAKLGV